MGEVYRATDTRLKRQAALKVLPAAVSGDPERLARFQREAEVLASLNHPHIAQIYGLEDDGAIRAIAMELVEGPTLADRIAEGPLPLDEALAIALQIAHALEAAHERGIIHRDLKPANIKVRPDGTVKVLDFGLAKLADPTGIVHDAGGLSLSPTITSPVMATGVGTLLGTATYMSPEQARGKAVDSRADIWAFGCVLFEMLTGQRAFAGGDVTETIASIIKSDVDWTRLPASTPASIRRVLRRCLQKEADRRLHHIADARLDIQEAGDADPVVRTPRRGQFRWAWPVAAVAAAAAVTTALWLGKGDTPPPPPLTRLELSLPPGVELFTSARNIILAPDGSSVVFVGVLSGSRQLYLRRFDEFEARAVRGTDGATTAFFSADSRSLGFVTFGGLLKTISLADGLVATLGNDVSFLHGGAWVPDGRIIFARNGALWQIQSTGGPATALTELSGQQSRHAWPHILPGGKTMLFAAQEGDIWRVESMNLDSRARQTVVQNGTLPLYVNSGYLVFFRDSQLIAAPFDAERATVTGPTVQLLDGLPALAPGIPLLDVAPTGTVVYAPTTAVSRLVWMSRTGDERPLNSEPRIYGSPRVSPDGQRISVQAGDLWLQDLARSTFTRLTTGSIVSNGFPTWTPDGRRLMYRSLQGLRIQDIANPGTGGDIVPGTNEFDYPGSLAPDGDTVVFLRTAADGSLDIMSLSLRDPRKVTSLVATAAYEGGARLSPDGKWLTYVSNETGRNEIYLRPFPGPGERWQVSTAGGTQPVWNPSGKELFYRVDKKLMAVEVTTQPAVALSPPRQLFEAEVLYGAGVTIANYDVSRDGQQFVMVKADPSSGRLNAVLNWFADPSRLAPQP